MPTTTQTTDRPTDYDTSDAPLMLAQPPAAHAAVAIDDDHEHDPDFDPVSPDPDPHPDGFADALSETVGPIGSPDDAAGQPATPTDFDLYERFLASRAAHWAAFASGDPDQQRDAELALRQSIRPLADRVKAGGAWRIKMVEEAGPVGSGVLGRGYMPEPKWGGGIRHDGSPFRPGIVEVSIERQTRDDVMALLWEAREEFVRQAVEGTVEHDRAAGLAERIDGAIGAKGVAFAEKGA